MIFKNFALHEKKEKVHKRIINFYMYLGNSQINYVRKTLWIISL